VNAAAAQRDERIPRVFARQVAVERQARRLFGRHVLHRMDRQIDPTVQKLILDLAREQPFVPDLLQGPVRRDHRPVVAGRLDDHDLERGLGQVEGRRQPITGFISLRQRQGRATGADLERFGRVGKFCRHGRRLDAANGPVHAPAA